MEEATSAQSVYTNLLAVSIKTLAPGSEDASGNESTSVAQYSLKSIGKIYSALDESLSSTRGYYEWLRSFADPRVEDWPLMASPWLVLSIFSLYLLMANYGPGLMKSRKPMELRWILVVYNLYVATLNL